MQEAKVLLTAEHDEHLIDGLLRAGSLSGPYRRRFLLGQRMGHVVGRLQAFFPWEYRQLYRRDVRRQEDEVNGASID